MLPTTELMLMMRPQRARVMPRKQGLIMRYKALRLVSMTESHSSCFMRSIILSWVIPALFTNTVGAPKRSCTSANAALTESLSVTFSTTPPPLGANGGRSEEHTSELQSRFDLVCRLLLEKKKR